MKFHPAWSRFGNRIWTRAAWAVQSGYLSEAASCDGQAVGRSSLGFYPDVPTAGTVPIEVTFAAPSERRDADASLGASTHLAGGLGHHFAQIGGALRKLRHGFSVKQLLLPASRSLACVGGHHGDPVSTRRSVREPSRRSVGPIRRSTNSAGLVGHSCEQARQHQLRTTASPRMVVCSET